MIDQPRHIAIIMDGNGRWAERRGLNTLDGHRAGAETVKRIIKVAQNLGVEYLTLYAFSTENWRRSKTEIDGLMTMLEHFIDDNIDDMMNKGIRLRTIGRWRELPASTVAKLNEAIDVTAENQAGTVVLALNYGGRAEIVDTVKCLMRKVAAGMDPEEMDELLFARHMYAPDIPDPDLMIRTSGEMRLSNFLLWQLAYSEIFVSSRLWPEFSGDDLLMAIDHFKHRDRRFGGRHNNGASC